MEEDSKNTCLPRRAESSWKISFELIIIGERNSLSTKVHEIMVRHTPLGGYAGLKLTCPKIS